MYIYIYSEPFYINHEHYHCQREVGIVHLQYMYMSIYMYMHPTIQCINGPN